MFQSTHSRRVRHEGNPDECRSNNVSIHALTKSATLQYWVTLDLLSFNPRTHEECDQNHFFLLNLKK